MANEIIEAMDEALNQTVTETEKRTGKKTSSAKKFRANAAKSRPKRAKIKQPEQFLSRDGARWALSEASHRMSDSTRLLSRRSDRAKKQLKKTVRGNPFGALFLSLGLGFVLGAVGIALAGSRFSSPAKHEFHGQDADIPPTRL